MEKVRILVVEDESIVAKDIRHSLEDLGYAVPAVVSTGEDAILKAAAERPDLVLMDIVLKGKMDGIEAAERIRADIDIPVVYLTAYSDREVLERAKMTEPFGFLIKPFHARELRSIIEMALYKHRMEKRLRASEEWLHATLKSIGDGVIATDSRGRVKFINPAAAALCGWEPSEAKGKPLGEVFNVVNEASGRKIEIPIGRLMGGGPPYDLERSKLAHHEGGTIAIEGLLFSRCRSSLATIEDSVSAIRKENGEPSGLVIAFRDVTRRRELEEKLAQSQKMEAIGTLAGGIAHDFNNILSAVFGYTEIAKAKLPADSPLKGDLDRVLDAGMRARDLVRRILTFSRQGETEQKPIQLTPVIDEALEMIRATLPSTIEIRKVLAPDSGAVLAAPTQIHQVLVNLCTNAYDAMLDTGGTLTVTLGEVTVGSGEEGLDLAPGPCLCLSVRDTGHGMDRATLSRIFEPYFTTKPPERGTGMGLALVHGIVKGCGGDIAVESRPGEGTDIRVYLQKITGAWESPSEGPAPLPRGSERLLVVDDEEALALMTGRMLEGLGYSVTVFTRGREALRTFRKRPEAFDLVITDQTMPQMTGSELASELLRTRPELPIVLCSGFSEVMNAKRARSLGIREYIMKPMVLRDLAEVVRRGLDGE